MKTLIEIAIECGAHLQAKFSSEPIPKSQRTYMVVFTEEVQLQSFVDAVNARDSQLIGYLDVSLETGIAVDLQLENCDYIEQGAPVFTSPQPALSHNKERIEALEKDAERLTILMTMSSSMYRESQKYQFVGRLREFIDANKEAIEEAMKGSNDDK